MPSSKGSLTQAQFVQKVAESTSMTKVDVKNVLSTALELVQKELKGGRTVTVLGAKFSVKDKPARPARDGINPFTKEKIRIAAKPASKQVRIKPAKDLKSLF